MLFLRFLALARTALSARTTLAADRDGLSAIVQPTTAPMHWAWPLVTLSVLLSCTTVFYHFKTPSTIAVGSSSSKRAPEAALASVWGAVDSDFDWCEHNYQLSAYVAEPLNSLTSVAYPVLALYAWRTHHHLAVSPYLKLALVVTA